MNLALPGGPAGALLIGLTLLAWLLAALRMLLHQRSGLPGVGLGMAIAVAAAGALTVHLNLLQALDLVLTARAIMRRAMLDAALQEALAPVTAVTLLASLALLPHLPLSLMEQPVRGRWLTRTMGAMALLVLLVALERSWGLHDILLELSPVLEQLDEPPQRVFRIIDAEARAPLEQATLLDLGALAVGGLAALLAVVVGVIGVIKAPPLEEDEDDA